jgi:iron complex outermembrane recepter protein
MLNYERLILASALLLPPSVALAQSATPLQTINVIGNPDKSSQPPLDTNVLQGGDLATQQATTSDTAEMLTTLPGVSLYRAGGVSGLPVLNGLADDRINILVGGVSLAAACANHMNPPLSYIDPHQVGKVTVFAGITPVSVGGDNIAGAILVDPPPPVFASAPSGVVAHGSLSSFYHSVNHGVSVSGTASVATRNFSFDYSGAWTQAGDYRAGGSGAIVRSTLYQSQNHAATLAYQNEGQSFAVTAGVQHIPYQGFVNQWMDMLGNNEISLSAHYTGAFSWGSADARVYWQNIHHYMNFLADKGGSTPESGMPMYTHGTGTGYVVKFAIPLSPAHLLRVGNEFHHDTLSDWWPAVPGSMMMGPNSYININDGQRNRFGTFAELESKWGHGWSSLLGIRNEEVWMNTGNVQPYSWTSMMDTADIAAARAFNAQSHARLDANFDLTALARYTPDTSQSFEFGYARATRSPNLYERYAWGRGSMATAMIGWFGDGNGYVGNLNLKPEVAHTFSATAAWHDPDAQIWDVRVTPYFTYVEDYIDVNQIGTFKSQGQTFNILQFENYAARLYGVNLSGHTRIWESPTFGTFVLTGVVGYVNGKNTDTGENLYHMMPLNGRFAIEQHLGGWSAAFETQLVAEKNLVEAVRLEQTTPAFAIFNLRASYSWQNFRVDFGVENLLNQFYYDPLGGFDVADFKATGVAQPVPAPGRDIYAGLTVTF